jgi:hypothetical protein
MKEQKPGWEYYHSEKLNLDYALHKKTGWVYFEDKVRYSPEEIKILHDSGTGEVTVELHNVKKIFEGEIVRYESRTGTTDKRKQDESGGGEDNNNNTNPGGKVPETTGTSPAVWEGELDIY